MHEYPVKPPEVNDPDGEGETGRKATGEKSVSIPRTNLHLLRTIMHALGVFRLQPGSRLQSAPTLGVSTPMAVKSNEGRRRTGSLSGRARSLLLPIGPRSAGPHVAPWAPRCTDSFARSSRASKLTSGSRECKMTVQNLYPNDNNSVLCKNLENILILHKLIGYTKTVQTHLKSQKKDKGDDQISCKGLPSYRVSFNVSFKQMLEVSNYIDAASK
ncbi:Uncharacterized protein DBV15_01104 [Temnothorax longispinosus]|uniref:Uncharacterized protein n=1 Tax=Temnothorax longispinosus TaxID=300112 RepID=A0A4S2J9Z1_9HYME|nr:Uncharacterized protein DBV15_01104 [Temnothorax longispinosus]